MKLTPQTLAKAIADLREKEHPSLYNGNYTQGGKGPTPGPTEWDKAYAKRLINQIHQNNASEGQKDN